MEASVFRNQILISKSDAPTGLDSFSHIVSGEWQIHFSSNVPVIQEREVLLLGWAWNCDTGRVVDKGSLGDITVENVVSKTIHYAGRYIIVLNGSFIVPDSTSSYSLYYQSDCVCTSLSLLSYSLNKTLKPEFVYSTPLVLPPGSRVPDVSKLIPGQYLCIGDPVKARSFEGFIAGLDDELGIDERLNSIVEHLLGCARGLSSMAGSSFRQALTGGKDSRLSFLALYRVLGDQLKTFTHRKPYNLDDPNDIRIPRLLSERLNTDHALIGPRPALRTTDMSLLDRHSVLMAGTKVPGSTYSYFKKGNWDQLEEEYVIGNFYEIGRMHLHGKNWLADASAVTFENVSRFGKISEEDFATLSEHLTLISGKTDLLDAFYFVKTYSSLSNEYEQLDFKHTPLIFCNSLFLIKSLLSVPEADRSQSRFHMKLIAELTPTATKDIPCNPSSTSIWFKVRRKLILRAQRALA